MKLRMTRNQISTKELGRQALVVACFCCLVTGSAWGQSGAAQAALSNTTKTDSLAMASDPASTLGMLVQRVARQVLAHYEKPWGRVVERRRSRVYVVPQGSPPVKDAQFLVLRPVPGMSPSRERLICKLKVKRVDRTIVECKEFERTGKEHAEEGDIVREEGVSTRVLLAPCISAVDLAPVISQVLGEKLRTQFQGRSTLHLIEDLELEKQVEVAYWSGTMPAFLSNLDNVDVVLVPVLLRSQEKLILNVEYFSVRRQAATDIAVGSIALNEMLLSWLRAGRTRDYSPPGYRSLPAQTYRWSLQAMTGLKGGGLLVAVRDSVRAFEFAYPGLQLLGSAALPSRDRTRQLPYVQLISAQVLQDAAQSVSPSNEAVTLDVSVLQTAGDVVWMMTDERRPMAVQVSAHAPMQVDSGGSRLIMGLQQFWLVLGGPPQYGQRWWPSPSGKSKIFYPLFADMDGDEVLDILWSDVEGVLQFRRAATDQRESLHGYGDIKCIQPAQSGNSNAVLWLTDPVWGNRGDHLTAVQYVGGRLRVVWRSRLFKNTLVALASIDLNSDGAIDLVVAERLPGGTRLHLFLALPGENTAARGGSWSE